MPVRIPWVLRDNASATPEEYLWEVNPNAFSMPLRKNIGYSNAAAPDGRVVAYEGRDEVRNITFSGVILTQAQYEEMEHWFNKRTQLELEDDLGRTMYVYITSFSFERQRSTQYPWKHTYNGEMIILDWP